MKLKEQYPGIILIIEVTISATHVHLANANISQICHTWITCPLTTCRSDTNSGSLGMTQKWLQRSATYFAIGTGTRTSPPFQPAV